MQLKKLQEQRAELLAKIELENKSETRSVETIDELLNDVEKINEEIKREERLLDMTNFTTKTKEVEKRDYNAEIRTAIELGKEINISDFELETVENRAIGMGAVAGQIEASVGNIAKKTFAQSIIEQATDKYTLFGKIRHEAMMEATHQVPVQKDIISDFLNVAELAQYEKLNFDFDTVNLGAHKYGCITVFSNEALQDSGYDLLGQLRKQYANSLQATLEKLVVEGDEAIGVEGLEMHNQGHGVELQEAEIANLTDEDIVSLIEQLYRALPMKYRANATWVLPQDVVDAISFAKDGVGRLLISHDYSQVPMGGQVQMYLLGRPVVASPFVKPLMGGTAQDKVAFFGDLSKCQIGSIRSQFTVKTSTEAGFLNDSTYVKASVRCDVKKGLAEAIAYIEVA